MSHFDSGKVKWHRYFDPSCPALEFLPGDRWEPYPCPAIGEFLLAIAKHLPEGAMVCIEATHLDRVVLGTLVRHSVDPTENVRPDTIGNKLRVFHLPASTRVLTEIGSLLQRNPTAEWGHHLKIYASTGILVHLHDQGAWGFYLSSYFEAAVRADLQKQLGCKFERV